MQLLCETPCVIIQTHMQIYYPLYKPYDIKNKNLKR